VLVLAILALAATVAARPPHAPPLYDGLGFPDEPYRYVQAPSDVPHGPPAAGGSNSAPVNDGTNAQLGLQTAEQGPQFAVFLPPGALTSASGATRVTVTATPLAPDGATPYGPINGNVYRVDVTSDAGPVTFNPQAVRSPMTLRATQSFPPDTAGVFRPSAQAPWTQVTTGMAGFNVYSVEFHGNGDYALVQPGTTAAATRGQTTTGSSGQGTRTVALVLLIAGGFILLILAMAVLARWRSAATRTGPPPE
jgi:hypothetical protein